MNRMGKKFVLFDCSVHAFDTFTKHPTEAPSIHCPGFQTNHVLGADHLQFTRWSNLKDFRCLLTHWVDEDGIIFLAKLQQVNCCEEIKLKVLLNNLSLCSDQILPVTSSTFIAWPSYKHPRSANTTIKYWSIQRWWNPDGNSVPASMTSLSRHRTGTTL